jgi:hypothetical protein
MDMLLNLREPGTEPGQAAAREHLKDCGYCQGELHRLDQRVARLKALPTLRPARDRWPETAARFRAERLRHRRRQIGFMGLAAAASVVLAVALPGRPDGSPGGRPQGRPQWAATSGTAEIGQIKERSQALENALSDYNPEGRVLDGRTGRIAQELEDQIARLDRQLEVTELVPEQTRDQELLRLWRERVGLLDALVDVHVTRASNAGL